MCVCVYLLRGNSKYICLYLSLHPIILLSPVVLVLLYPLLFPPSVSYNHCLYPSHPMFSHLLTYFTFPSSVFLLVHLPSHISPLKPSIPSPTPIYSPTLQPHPIICLSFPITFFLFLSGPLGFRALCLPTL